MATRRRSAWDFNSIVATGPYEVDNRKGRSIQRRECGRHIGLSFRRDEPGVVVTCCPMCGSCQVCHAASDDYHASSAIPIVDIGAPYVEDPSGRPLSSIDRGRPTTGVGVVYGGSEVA